MLIAALFIMSALLACAFLRCSDLGVGLAKQLAKQIGLRASCRFSATSKDNSSILVIRDRDQTPRSTSVPTPVFDRPLDFALLATLPSLAPSTDPIAPRSPASSSSSDGWLMSSPGGRREKMVHARKVKRAEVRSALQGPRQLAPPESTD